MKIPLFDIDGTIIKPRNPLKREAYSQAFKEVYGVEASVDEINPEGMVDTQIVVDVLKLHGLTEEEIKSKMPEAVSHMAKFYKDNIANSNLEVLPGVVNLLKALKERNIPTGLLTGNVEDIAWTRMENLGIKNYFLFGAFGNQAYIRTDLVEIARQKASEVLNKSFKTDDFIIIGDTPRDAICARKTGLKVILVSSGPYSYEELEKEKPDLLVHDLETEGEKVLDFILNN